MVSELTIFQSVEHLEPRCPNCDSKIEYDVTTYFDEEKEKHVCKGCGHVLD